MASIEAREYVAHHGRFHTGPIWHDVCNAYDAGARSRDAEIESLKAQIEALMTDRDVFHDMHEEAAAFVDRVGVQRWAASERRHMRAAFLAGAAWHDGLSSQEAALLRAQAGIRTRKGTEPSPEALEDDFGGATWEARQRAEQALKDAQSAVEGAVRLGAPNRGLPQWMVTHNAAVKDTDERQGY